MTGSTLEDLEGSFLDEPCMAILGDTITYKPVMGSATTIKAYVDFPEEIQSLEGGRAVAQEITVQVLISDVPVRPSGACRVTIRKLPGLTYKPVNVRRDRSGSHWEFELVQANG